MKPILGARLGHLLAIIFFCFLPVYIKQTVGLVEFGEYILEIYILAGGAFFFIVGAYLPKINLINRGRYKHRLPRVGIKEEVNIQTLKYVIYLLSIPAFVLGIQYFNLYGGTGLYEVGGVPPLPTYFQMIFYSNLTLFFFACAVWPSGKIKQIIPIFFVVLIPRIIVTTSYGRWFVGQMLLPVAIFYIAKYYAINYDINKKNTKWPIAAAVFVLLLIFISGVLRESSDFSIDLLVAMIRGGGVIDILKLHSDYVVNETGNYVIASSFFKTFPFLAPSNYSVTVWGRENMVATLDRVITLSIYGSNPSAFFGTASNYVFEWYLSFGILGVIIGPFIVGRIARYIDNDALKTPLGVFFFMELYPRIFLLPRSNFGYLIERVLWLYLIYAVLLFSFKKKSIVNTL